MLAQVTGAVRRRPCPTSTTRRGWSRWPPPLAELRARELVSAYHDRSDGGLWATACEMAFAGAAGVDGRTCRRRGPVHRGARGACWCTADPDAVLARAGRPWPRRARRVVRPRRTDDRRVRVVPTGSRGDSLLDEPLRDLAQAWDEVSWRIAALRDNPECADEEHAAVGARRPRARRRPDFDPTDDVAAPLIATGARPRVAILREQGVNSHVETAHAFAPGRVRRLRRAHDRPPVRAGSTWPTRSGWWPAAGSPTATPSAPVRAGPGRCCSTRGSPTRSPPSSPATTPSAWASATAARCSPRWPTSIPGAEAWPRFTRNSSEQYEARLTQVEVLDSPSVLLPGHGRQPRPDRGGARRGPGRLLGPAATSRRCTAWPGSPTPPASR